MTSPTSTRSKSWASGPSPSASTTQMSADDLEHLLVHQREPAGDVRGLVPVAQLDQREDLAGDVAVLAPPAQLVVADLGQHVGEGGRLGVLVHLVLPAQSRRPPPSAPAP